MFSGASDMKVTLRHHNSLAYIVTEIGLNVQTSKKRDSKLIRANIRAIFFLHDFIFWVVPLLHCTFFELDLDLA